MTVLTLIGRTGKRNQGYGRKIGNRNLPISGLLDAITLTYISNYFNPEINSTYNYICHMYYEKSKIFCLNIILSTYIFIIHP